MDPTRRSFLGGGVLGGVVVGGLRADRAEAAGSTAPGPVPVAFVLDGAPAALEVGEDDDAAHALRRRCGKTGVKVACGVGACGACTITLDGVPHVSCLLPAAALHGRAVGTVHGLDHAVQRAFAAHDALQCGFCTPGFVVEAAAFVDAWRAEHGPGEPAREAVAAALAGHLCRCGAYAAIHEAVAAACRGDFDAPGRPEGERVEAAEKVTGAAVFPSDVVVPGMLEAVVLRSPHPHAVLVSLDLAPCLAAGAAAAVRMMPDGARARFVGQEVAAVAAADRATGERALRAARVLWRVLPAALTDTQAVAPDAPLVWADRADAKAAPSAAEGLMVPARWEGNTRGPASFSILTKPAMARRAIDDSDFAGRPVVRGRYRTAAQAHTALEPHGAVARWTGSDALEVWASTQSVNFVADDLAERFGLPRDRVTVRADHVGGGFGAKVGLAVEHLIAVLLAREAQAPVRYFNDRAEEVLVGGFRPGVRFELDVAVTEDDGLAIRHAAWGEPGCAVGNATGHVTRLLYDTPLKDIDDTDVVTHAPPGKPMRGPGGPPALFALESAMDALAERAGISPIALRRRHDPNVPRGLLYDWAEALPRWRDRADPGAGRVRRGVGLAAGTWVQTFDSGTQVELEATADGVVARCGTQDVGSGVRSLLAHAVADALGLPRGSVRTEVGDSRLVHGPVAGGSRGTASLVPAAEDAARRLADALADLRRERGLPADAPLAEVLAGEPAIRVVGRRRADDLPPLVPIAVTEFKVGRRFPATVAVVEVTVDTATGVVRVVGADVGVAVGRIVNPRLARSQVEGSFVQSVGYALHEERRIDPRSGRLVTASLEDYHLPGIAEIPPIGVHFEERGFEHVRGGAVGVGEIGGVAVPAAIANAVAHAIGRRPTRLPLRPEAVRSLLA